MNVSGSKHESGSIWSAKKIKKQAEYKSGGYETS